MKYFVTARLSEKIHETPEGFLVCVDVPIARTGEMIYGPGESPIEVGPDGKAIVTREAKELFKPETVASFEGKPFTINHPEGFVNPKNWKMLAKGVLQNVRRGSGENENDMLADVLVTDHDAIQLVKGGLRDVSCGYEAEYTQLGIGRGMQTNIIGNHLALVEQGRAGSAYAINDQKGAKMKNLGEKIRGIFAKAGDEAAKVVDESSETPPAKKTGDEMPEWAKTMQKELNRVTDSLAAQQPSSGKPGTYSDEFPKKEEKKADDAAEGEEADKDDDKAKDADMPPWADAMMKVCNSIMEKLSGKSDDEAEEEEESEDAEGEEEEASEDDDFEESPAAAVGDEASRIEILAPGLKTKGKDAKRAALLKAYEAKDTKAIIDRLNGGKAVDLKKASSKTVDHLFIGASEVVGLYRTKNFSKWKQVRDSQSDVTGSAGEMTPEKINEINAKHYSEQKGVH